MDVKELLDKEVLTRDTVYELSYEKPDPLMIAKRYNDEHISLICAMFAYGKASMIVKFLDSLNFELLDKSDEVCKKELQNHYYRFQNSRDVCEIFITIKRLRELGSLEELFLKGYSKSENILDGLYYLIDLIYSLNSYKSSGYEFLIGKKESHSPHKRWNMFFRWMVRCDNLDMGLWSRVKKSSLIIPLDTHTFHISQKLGLINRKSYDLKSALLISEKLREFDIDDPIKYDFALYRIGQEMII